MPLSMYKVSVQIFVQMLTSLSAVLDKGVDQPVEQKLMPMDVVRKTATQTTQIVQKQSIDTSDGPAMLWAAVRRWMAQIDPSYME